MKARNALILLLSMVILSTAIGVLVAFGYWGDVYPTDLRSGKRNALLILIGFEGQGPPLTPITKQDVARVLEDLLPAALNMLAKHSLVKELDHGMALHGLVVSWTGDNCTLEYAERKGHSSSDLSLPVIEEWKERERGLRLRCVHCALTFSDDQIVSAVVSFRLGAWSLQRECAEPLDVGYFWSDGLVESRLHSGTELRSLLVQLEQPEGRHLDPGVRAYKLPDILYTLSECVRQHLAVFSKNELDLAFNAATDDGCLHNIALGVERACLMHGAIIPDCAMTHTAYINSQMLDFIRRGDRTIPLGTGHLCYTIFGL